MSLITVILRAARISPARVAVVRPPFTLTNTMTLHRQSRALSTVPSDQLGFIPEKHTTTDAPIANADDRKISILWSPQNWSRFHHIWLRDHCRCPECFHSETKQRLLNTFQIPPDIKPQHVQSSPEGLEVVWPNFGAEARSHSSLYPWSWLKAHTYDPPLKSASTFGDKVLWGARISKSPPTVSYADTMADEGMYKWLSNIDKFGFCLVSGVPATPEATEDLSKRIGFIRETQYGKFWQVTADMMKLDTAYTAMALGAHTDNTYFTDPCGLQLFHVVSHTGSGGATLLVDGFYVASLLKELHSDAYELLSRIPIPAHAAGEGDAFYQPNMPNGYPPLRHDAASGELVQVRWNNDDRSVMDHLDPELVEPWYDAIRKWHALVKSSDSEYWVQLTPGTVLSVHNQRVMHGRSSFAGQRHLCGAYIGVDEYRSRLAVLRERTLGQARSVWNAGL